MCPWVGPHVPSFGRQLWGLPSRVEYLSPQGVLVPLVYGTTASPLWLDVRGLSAWQAIPSWTVYRLACHRFLPWLWVTFAMVPDAAWPGSDQRPWGTAPAAGPVGWLGRPSVSNPWHVGPFCPSVALCVHLCAVSWATLLLFTGVPARCVVLRVRCPGPLCSCSPVCPLGVLCCVCGLLGHLAPAHRCARSVRCFADAVSWATSLLFTVVPARCVALLVRCPWALGSCSPVCPLRVLYCVCGVLGHFAPIHQCARSVRCIASALSWATSLLFTGAPAWFVVLRVRCPGPLGSCWPVCLLCVLCFVCGVLGHLAPVHRCARSVRCFGSALSWATPLLFTGAPAWFVVLRVRCSWATWLLLAVVPALCVVLRLRCPGPLCSCSPVCPLAALLCVLGVLGHLAPVHRCACVVCCVACAVSWAT